VRSAELENAHAQLISFDDRGLASAISPQGDNAIPLHAPATGRVLQVIQQNETTLPVGSPIMEIGNIDDDLEVVAELLSTDAVQVGAGDRVIIDKWGGPEPLDGVVERVDPLGFTKFSALGVEEQRVNAVIGFTSRDAYSGKLGHGFRVEVRIVVQEETGALLVPASALFRAGDDWAVFLVEDGVISRRLVTLSGNNGLEAGIAKGLSEGDVIVLYPVSGLGPGTKVAQQ
jgi:HlyD family secretion protein